MSWFAWPLTMPLIEAILWAALRANGKKGNSLRAGVATCAKLDVRFNEGSSTEKIHTGVVYIMMALKGNL